MKIWVLTIDYMEHTDWDMVLFSEMDKGVKYLTERFPNIVFTTEEHDNDQTVIYAHPFANGEDRKIEFIYLAARTVDRYTLNGKVQTA